MIKSLADYVVNGGDSASIVAYILIVSFTLFSMLTGSFLKSYATEKGKNYASKEDVDKIINQLKMTTEATEKIKSSIEHGIWRKKEIEALKRKKLEEYIKLIARLSTEVDKEVLHKFHGITSEYDSNLYSVVEGVRVLYLPELARASISLSNSMSKYKMWLANGMLLKNSEENKNTNGKLMQEHMVEYKAVLSSIGEATSGINLEVYRLASKLNTFEE